VFDRSICLILCWLLLGVKAAIAAGDLSTRIARFPNWNSKPEVEKVTTEDLVYPDWMAGTWEVTSTLETRVAPLAPEIVTPGFEGNRQYLHRPMHFRVRFEAKPTSRGGQILALFTREKRFPVVADRAFNGLEIARSYLGDGVVSVKVDPNHPHRQITQLRSGRQLISTVTGRRSETPNPTTFIATEITQQFFRQREVYLNEVEATTAYQYRSNCQISADQITAIYLSPQDPSYFQAGDRPVALYRYHLDLERQAS